MIATLPTITIEQGLTFFQEYRLLDGPEEDELALPNWLQYTATFSIAKTLADAPIYAGAVTILADGYMTIEISPTDTAAMEFDRAGHVVGIAEIDLADELGEPAFKLQAPVRLIRSMK